MNLMKKRPMALLSSQRHHFISGRYQLPRLGVFPFAASAIALLALAVHASDTVLQGHLTVTKHPTEIRSNYPTLRHANRSTVLVPAESLELVDKYGEPAALPAVTEAIKKAEGAAGGMNAKWVAGAKAAADRYEALEHGCVLPGSSPMQFVEYGYLPPGMSPEQVAMLSRGLPHIPRMTRATTPEDIVRMTGESADSMSMLPFGATPAQARAANERQFSGYLRERFGPKYFPRLHRDPGCLPQHGERTVTSYMVSSHNQMSLIRPQYVYDGGRRPSSMREMTDSSGNAVSEYTYDPYGRQSRIGGTGPDADFGYAGYYVHQRSGLNLTVYRAYSPTLGRWLSRDPIGEPGFSDMMLSPESTNPTHTMSGATGWLAESQSANKYVYVLNSPINYRDPLGLFPPAAPPSSGSWGATSNCLDFCAFEQNVDLAERSSGTAKKGICPNLNNCMKNCMSQAAQGTGPGIYGSGWNPHIPNSPPRLTWP